MGMRKTAVLLASIVLAVLLATGVALAQSISTAADTKYPRVVDVRPTEGATGVSQFPTVVAYFSEDMRERSVWWAINVYKEGSDTPITDYTVWYNKPQRKVILDPEIALKRGATYKAVISTQAKDLAGNRLDQNRNRDGLQPNVWCFTIDSRNS
jgi:hypothetical protein